MKITEKDVGREVKMRNGDIGVIVEWDSGDPKYPVCVRHPGYYDGAAGYREWYTTHGSYSPPSGRNPWDIVGFVEDML